MSRRVGRPAVRREPNERVPVATRIKGALYNRLIDAAGANDRPLANEIELRLERTFDPILPEEDRALMMAFWGPPINMADWGAVLRLMLTTLDNPDAEEIARRCELAFGAQQSIARAASTDPRVEKSGFQPPELKP